MLGLFFPKKCLSCQEALKEKGSLCASCLSKLRFIQTPWCDCCGTMFQATESLSHLCGSCILEKKPFQKGRSLLFYEGPTLNLIHRWKYQRDEAVGVFFKQFLKETLEIRCQDFDSLDVIIPIPLSRARLKERLFNQSYQWAQEVGRSLKTPVAPLCLKRQDGFETHQAHLTRKERFERIRGAFIVDGSGQKKILGKKCLLVDDVITTGATMMEAARVLKKAGAAEVSFLTLART